MQRLKYDARDARHGMMTCTCNYVVQYVYVRDRTRSDSCTVEVPGIVARGRDESVERVSRSAPFNAFLLGEAHGSAVVPNLSWSQKNETSKIFRYGRHGGWTSRWWDSRKW